VADERVVLTRDQVRVIQAVYDRLRESGTWPRFGEIDRQLDSGPRRIDVGQAIQHIPSSLLQPLGSPPAASLEYPMRLTLEGVARCKGSEDDVSLFLRALRWMARRERNFKPATADGIAAATVDSQQLMRALKISKRCIADVSRLGVILMVERWGWSSGGGPRPDQTWNFTLTRDIRRFSKVQTLDDYRAAHKQWDEETQPSAQFSWPQQIKRESLPTEPQAANGDYVDQQVIAAIEGGQVGSTWQCDKLLHLIAELNDNYHNNNAHSAHAMLRAILDHIPPLFGYTDFAEVANNYRWSRTDKLYMKRLLETKLQGDEALHSPISQKPGSQLSIHDLPPRRQINRLLEECATLL